MTRVSQQPASETKGAGAQSRRIEPSGVKAWHGLQKFVFDSTARSVGVAEWTAARKPHIHWLVEALPGLWPAHFS